MSEIHPVTIWLVIAGMAAVNFGIRYTPIAVLSRFELHPGFLRWLSFVPISVMGALVALAVLRPNSAWQPPLTNPAVWASLLTAVAFHRTRSFLGATVVGMVSYVALRAIIG
jgi:branched-subunit amino acid transport protein